MADDAELDRIINQWKTADAQAKESREKADAQSRERRDQFSRWATDVAEPVLEAIAEQLRDAGVVAKVSTCRPRYTGNEPGPVHRVMLEIEAISAGNVRRGEVGFSLSAGGAQPAQQFARLPDGRSLEAANQSTTAADVRTYVLEQIDAILLREWR